jgi:hypothetical protein
MDRFNFKDVEAFNNVYNKYLRFDGRSFPDTHHGRLKIIEDLMVRWRREFPNHNRKIYMDDMDWVEEQMYEWLPEHGKNGLTKEKIKKANIIFKRYGGRNLQYEIIQDFEDMYDTIRINEPIIRKKKVMYKLVRSK